MLVNSLPWFKQLNYSILSSNIMWVYLIVYLLLLIRSEVVIDNHKEINKNPYLEYFKYLGLFFILEIPLFIYLYYTGKPIYNWSILLSLSTVLITQLITINIQDVKYHQVDRYINRLGYFTSILLSLLYILNNYTIENINHTIKILIILEIVLIILFFIIQSVGAADFRILMMISPVFIISLKEYFLFGFIGSLLCASLYQFIKQKQANNKKLPVPIGHILINFGYITFLTQLIRHVV